MGFAPPPHKNMEIIPIPILGTLSHKDSIGNMHSVEVGGV